MFNFRSSLIITIKVHAVVVGIIKKHTKFSLVLKQRYFINEDYQMFSQFWHLQYSVHIKPRL